ncbi:MAG: CHAD domain-containing protein [Actinomycetota bacterium]|nr:CHAD domain-containing protein [Actinomycetota bacterium]
MTARGTQMLLPDGLSGSAAADALAAEIAIVTQRARTIERTFWDTFDGRLHDAGLALIVTRGRLALADATTYEEEVGDALQPVAEWLFADDVPVGPLRERLAALLEMRAAMPIARVRSRLLAVSVLDEEGKTVVRLRVEEPAAVAGPSAASPAPLRPRLHVIGVRGYDGELEDVRALLTRRLGLVEAQRPVQDDAVAASGGTPGGTSSKLRVKLRPEQRADAAAVMVLTHLLATIEANLPGTLADVDTEFLHDLRVAVRRSRALQRELSGVFEPEPLRRFRAGFKNLQAVTGPTRDLDVQLLEFEELTRDLPPTIAPDVAPLHTLLQRRREVARAQMVAALNSPGIGTLLEDWAEHLDELTTADEANRPNAAGAVGEVAGARIAKVYKRMVRMGKAIDDGSPHEALHDLRKQSKELRYLLEFFSSLYPADVHRPMVSSLKALQDVLGRFQDREVQAVQLRSIGDEIAALDGGAAALMAMGVLVQRLADDQQRAREQFAERFEAFASKERRKLVKRTFA